MAKKEEAKKPEVKERAQQYHVKKHKNAAGEYDGKWEVKIGGSDRAIKLFDTQQEALDHA